MKSLRIALVTMSLCAAIVHAQETTADGAEKKAAQPEVSRATGLAARGSAAPADESKGGEVCRSAHLLRHFFRRLSANRTFAVSGHQHCVRRVVDGEPSRRHARVAQAL